MMEEKLIPRPQYIEQLQNWLGQTELVKIITGVRRCGKSKLLSLFQTYLLNENITTDKNIISINLEDPVQTSDIGLKLGSDKLFQDYKIFLDYILEKITPDQRYYVFLDEIQLLKDWQQLANGLRLRGNIDLYLTGSNAYMFSSDIANSFGGRYIEIKMYPLSFKEYVDFFIIQNNLDIKNIEQLKQTHNIQDLYKDYIHYSGFPQVQYLFYKNNKKIITDYLMDTVFQNTIQKDVVKRFGILNDTKLDSLIRFLFDNIAHETSLRNIEKILKNNKFSISVPTIDTYVTGLLDSFLMYKCNRFDIKGKKILTGLAKYYIVDIGLRYALLGYKETDVGFILENVVYLELIRRGYKVFSGKIPASIKDENGKTKSTMIEVDFIATKPTGKTEYYQVSWSIFEDPKVFNRELLSLEQIKDNYPKFILSMDSGESELKGIKRINVLDWLLEKDI